MRIFQMLEEKIPKLCLCCHRSDRHRKVYVSSPDDWNLKPTFIGFTKLLKVFFNTKKLRGLSVSPQERQIDSQTPTDNKNILYFQINLIPMKLPWDKLPSLYTFVKMKKYISIFIFFGNLCFFNLSTESFAPVCLLYKNLSLTPIIILSIVKIIKIVKLKIVTSK